MHLRLQIPTLLLTLLLAAPAQAQWVHQSPTPTGLAIRDVAFVTPERGFLATSGSFWDEPDRRALLETTDGGATWTHRLVPTNDDQPLNGLFFLDGQRGWAFGNQNYRTTDGGQTWQALPFLGSTDGMRFYTPTFGRAFGNFGFARTTDGGQTWTLNPAGPRNFSFRDDLVGVGVGADAIYRTTDGGQTFTPVYSQGSPSGDLVTFLTPSVAVAIAGGSFVRSTDGGQTWAPAAPAQGRNMLLRVSDAVVLAWNTSGVAPNPDGRLLRSDDGGQTWADLGTVFPSGSGRLVAASPTLVLATDTDGDVYRSSDAGATWSLVFDVPFFGAASNGMPLVFPSAEVGYLAYDYGHLYKTTDGGLTWAQLSNGTGRDLADLVWLGGQHLVAVGLGGVVLVTEDGGAKWHVRQDGMELAHDLVAAQTVGPLHVAATDALGRVFQSTDGGHTWARTGVLPDPTYEFRAYDLHFFDAQNGWVVGTRYNLNAVYRTADGGQTWTPGTFPGLWVAVDFEGDRGWIADNRGHYLRTTDGGQTWTPGTFPPDQFLERELEDIEFFDESTGYVCGWNGYLAKSTDGGQTWTLLNTGTVTHKFSDIHLNSPDDVWLSTYDDRVYHSADGGQTWEVLTVGSAPLAFGSFTGVVATPEGQVWTAGFKGYVYTHGAPSAPVAVAAAPVSPPVTIPAGGGSFQFRVTLTNTTAQPQTFQAWTAVTGPVSREPVVGPQTVTLPAGATVTKTLRQRVPPNAPAGTYTYHVRLGSFPSGVTASDSFTFTKQGSVAARGGDGADDWTASGTLSGDEAAASAVLPEGFALSEAHPNPSAGQVRLTLEVAVAQRVRAEVFDALGRRVAVLLNGEAEAGTHALVFDGSSLPAGVYVVRVTGEAFAATRRVTLAR